MSQAWMVASGKGGVGKSVITAALGTALARRNLHCIVMDADIGLRNLDLILGLESKVVFDVLDVIQKDCKLKCALIQDAKQPFLSLLAASQMGKPSDLDAVALEWIVKKLKKRFPYILMDAPAGLASSLSSLLQSADHTLLITTPDDVAIRDAERVVTLLEAWDKPRPLLIVNQVYPELVKRGEMYSPRTVANILDIPLLGFIPNDLHVLRAVHHRESFMDVNCPARKAVERICSRFMGEYVPMPDLERKRSRLIRPREETLTLL